MTLPAELKTLGDKRILFVMAAKAEYGPHLKTRISPLMTGIGPVEAAVVLSSELQRLKGERVLPDLVVSLGSAGSRTLEQAEVYQAVSVSYRDMDASALGFPKGQTPFLDIPITLDLPHRIAGLKEATLSTGANIVSGKAYDAIDAQMVDMETFSLLRACQRFDVPLIGLRGISDGAAELQQVSDWTEYLHVIDEKLANAVDMLAIQLEQGSLAL
jgi:adenosylhomocysteine nucleosidase